MFTVSQLCVYCAGALTLLLGVFHVGFYRLFGWNKEFEVLAPRSRKVVYTLHLALLLLFFGLGALLLLMADELAAGSRLAMGLNGMLAAFWLWRTLWQAAYLRPDPSSRMRLLQRALLGVFALLAVAHTLAALLAWWGTPAAI